MTKLRLTSVETGDVKEVGPIGASSLSHHVTLMSFKSVLVCGCLNLCALCALLCVFLRLCVLSKVAG